MSADNDVNTWANININIYIGLISSAFLLTMYEISRRVSFLSQALFDRKRSIVPWRTPPPLMVTRLCWKFRHWPLPSLFEFLFLSLDKEYIEYADAVCKLLKQSNDERLPTMTTTPRSKSFITNISNEETRGNLPNCPSRLKHFCIYPSLRGPTSLFSSHRTYSSDHEASENKAERVNQRNISSLILQAHSSSLLSTEDIDLLQFIGLDSFIMIRFLRFGFEVSAFFFLLSCIVLIPTYYTSQYTSVSNSDATNISSVSVTSPYNTTSITYGYYSITIDHLKPGSSSLWVPFLFATLVHSVILWRWWLEWNVISCLIHDFLADGDPGVIRDDNAESLTQHRNTVLVENVPKFYRTSEDLYEFFETLYPGQVRRAEMIYDTRKLNSILRKRKVHIDLYESIAAKYRHRLEIFARSQQSFYQHHCRLLRPKTVEPPSEPVVRSGAFCWFGGRSVPALSFHMAEIERLHAMAEYEYTNILTRKRGVKRTLSSSNVAESYSSVIFKAISPQTATSRARKESSTCGNGFVEFRSRSTKAGATQCNLTGEYNFMITTNVPDPRDVIWANVTLDKSSIERRCLYVSILLGLGVLFWSAFVTFLSSIVNEILIRSQIVILPAIDRLLKSYLPVLLITVVLTSLPSIFRALAINVIRFRSISEVDKFVFVWNVGYHIMNLCVILISGTLFTGLHDFTHDPDAVAKRLASGILAQSQFYFDIVIIATFQAVPLQLSQAVSVVYQLMIKNVVTFDSLSDRKRINLEQPKQFLFGRFCPQFVYCFAIALIYSTSVPLVLGACSVYFFLATKVYTHQALYVFCQPCEGGGKLMRCLSVSVFCSLYISITIFAVVLSLKSGKATIILAPIFFSTMVTATNIVQKRIYLTFTKPSQTLPLARARFIDTSNIRESREVVELPSMNADIDIKDFKRNTLFAQDDDSHSGQGMGLGRADLDRYSSIVGDFLYRQPEMNKTTWEKRPAKTSSSVALK